MSIVGTRPPLIGEVSEYELHHRARLAIKPGITGMWQVSGRSDITDFEEVVGLITYAAACGSASIQGLSEKNRTILKSLMTKYKIISVRDLHTYNYVKNLYDGKVERHLDPVLVGDLYKRKHNPVKLKKYMIVYAYGNRIRDEKEISRLFDRCR